MIRKSVNKLFDVLTSDTPQAFALFIGIVTVEIAILAYFTARNGY
jgi:hypothetical protein